MSDNDIDASELARWDPAFTAQANKLVAPIINRWFRVEVRGLESVPPTGGVLLVSNHSGGALTPDPLVFGPAYYDRFGYHRPLYILAHYGVFFTPLRGYLGRIGAIHANPENAAKALHSGAAVLVYPGGDYDAYRPTLSQNVIDFNGRTGYVKVAVETGCRFSPRGGWRFLYLQVCRILIKWRSGFFLIFGADPRTVRLYANFKIRGLLRRPMPLQPLFEQRAAGRPVVRFSPKGRTCMAHLPANRLAARSRSSPALILALPVNATSSSRKNSTWRGTL
jgi:1-acyl-sn-glycerol-3-phosphate acyltransferase